MIYISFLDSTSEATLLLFTNAQAEVEVPRQSRPEVNPAEQNLANIQASGQSRIKIIRDEIESLTQASLADLLSEFRVSVVDQNKSPAILQRLDAGNWQSSFVMGELLIFYWKKTRKTEWSSTLLPIPS